MSVRRRKCFRMVPLEDEVYNELVELRGKVGAETFTELVKLLISTYREYSTTKRRLIVKTIMCNDLRESRASMVGWVKLLSSRATIDILPLCLEYLMKDPTDPEMFIINREKCVEP